MTIAAMMFYAISAPSKVRSMLLLCMAVQMPFGALIQVWYPFNDPAPAFPSEMPWPVIGLQISMAAIGVLMNEDDDMKGK